MALKNKCLKSLKMRLVYTENYPPPGVKAGNETRRAGNIEELRGLRLTIFQPAESLFNERKQEDGGENNTGSDPESGRELAHIVE